MNGWTRVLTLAAWAFGLLGEPAFAATGTAVEFFNSDLESYFVTADPDEVAALEDGVIPGWAKTGYAFSVATDGSAGELPVCRFFSATFAPKSSHFYTPYQPECEALKGGATWTYESIAFYLTLPSSTGTCPPKATPIYRLYNNGVTGAPNHRYTSSPAAFAAMQSQGWAVEGSGTTGIFACGPPAPGGQSATASIVSTKTGRSYDVTIYVPVGYDSYSAPVPVIYALDAQFRYQSLVTAMQQSGAKAILVQIYDMGERQTDFNMPGAYEYLAFLTKDLIPFVEANYRADTRKRVLSGLSTGGNFPLHALFLEAPGKWSFAHYWSTEGAFWQQQADIFAEEERMFELIGGNAFPVTLILARASPNGPYVKALYDKLASRHYRALQLFDKPYPFEHVETDVPAFLDAIEILFGTAKAGLGSPASATGRRLNEQLQR